MASHLDVGKELDCSICLHIYKDPVNLQCGHNYCRECIDRVLDTQARSGRYSCPVCREKFPGRPAVHRNLTLWTIVDSLSSPQPGERSSGNVCTYCLHFPVSAVKSCLLCEVYLCESHLKVHNQAAEHVISDHNASMKNRKCIIHQKILEYYCIEDATCVCVYCLIGEHTGHKKESLDEAFETQKEKLSSALGELRTTREETDKEVQSLKVQQRKAEEKTAGDTKRLAGQFRDLKTKLEDQEKRVMCEISRKAEKVSLLPLIQQLELKKDKLSRKIHHIEELCNTTDPLTLLQEPGMGDLCDTEDGQNEDRKRPDDPLHDGGDVDVDGISHTLHTLSDMLKGLQRFLHTSAPADIYLDENTAGNSLMISDDRKTAYWSSSHQSHPETPEIFQCAQVISSQSFSSGHHCWDVDVASSSSWKIGMCYPSIERTFWPQVLIGNNYKSWCLQMNEKRYSVIHDSKEVKLSAEVSSNRVRICLDYEAGELSFYELSGPIQHLHTFTASFTEPLHAGLWLGSGSIKLLGGSQ